MRTLIVATKNAGKMREIKEILSDLPYHVISMEEAGIDEDIIEDGNSFEENALIKAKAIWKLAGGGNPEGMFPDAMVLADDSGLEVDALGGAPGIHSARYGGPGLDDVGRYRLLLKNMEGIPVEARTARFVCAMVLVTDEAQLIRRGTVSGRILEAPCGSGGFGYDPVFWVTEANKGSAEMDAAEKNRISHRGRALADMREAMAHSAAAKNNRSETR